MGNETTLTPAQIRLVRQTWGQIVPIADTAARIFYDRLFETSPQLAPLFDGADLPAQRKKLVQAINRVVLSLDRIDQQLPVIRDLGRRHVDYGVEAAHYGDVGAALLWTLEAGLGEAWSDDAETAWTNAYGMLAGAMIDGAGQDARAG